MTHDRTGRLRALKDNSRRRWLKSSGSITISEHGHGLLPPAIGRHFIWPVSVFICYADADNTSTDPRLRWLDRLLEFLRPLVRYEQLGTWSDKELSGGESWHGRIQKELAAAKAAVLLISPAFLASDYIASSEVPVLLKQAADRGMKIIPVILSPCLYEETRFKYPDWRTGPDELLLGSLQSINPPSRTLIEMPEGEQNRVLLAIARQLASWLEEDKVRREEESRQAEETRKQEHSKQIDQLKLQIEQGSFVNAAARASGQLPISSGSGVGLLNNEVTPVTSKARRTRQLRSLLRNPLY